MSMEEQVEVEEEAYSNKDESVKEKESTKQVKQESVAIAPP